MDGEAGYRIVRLSCREQEILVRLAQAPNKHTDIARDLAISMSTLNGHLVKMREKTGTTSTVQLVLWGFREALRAARPVVLVVGRKNRPQIKIRL